MWTLYDRTSTTKRCFKSFTIRNSSTKAEKIVHNDRLSPFVARDPEAFDSNDSEDQHPNIRIDSPQISVDPNHAEEDKDPTPGNTLYPMRERKPRTVEGVIA